MHSICHEINKLIYIIIRPITHDSSGNCKRLALFIWECLTILSLQYGYNGIGIAEWSGFLVTHRGQVLHPADGLGWLCSTECNGRSSYTLIHCTWDPKLLVSFIEVLINPKDPAPDLV